MIAKLIVVAVVATVAGGLSACAGSYAIPQSASDCRYARPLPKHFWSRNWTVSAGEGCQHFRPAGHSYGYSTYGHPVYKD